MDSLQTVLMISLTATSVAVAVHAFILLHGQWRDKRIRELEKRIDRTEWDWDDLKRLHPALVKDFPNRPNR